MKEGSGNREEGRLNLKAGEIVEILTDEYNGKAQICFDDNGQMYLEAIEEESCGK